MNTKRMMRFGAPALLLAMMLAACQPLIAGYSQHAYENATSLKVDALNLVGKAESPYGGYSTDVDALMTRVEKAYEYAKGLPHNKLSNRQWEIMKDPNRNLLGGFFRFWKEHGKVSKGFVAGAQKNIGQGFDLIICLEINKKDAENCFGDKGSE